MQILFYEMKERERGKIKKRRRMRRFKGKGMEEPAGIGRARQKGTKSISKWQQGERRCNLLSTLCLSNNAVSPVSLPLFIVSVTRNTDLRAPRRHRKTSPARYHLLFLPTLSSPFPPGEGRQIDPCLRPDLLAGSFFNTVHCGWKLFSKNLSFLLSFYQK